MQQQLIDDRGRIRQACSSQLRAELGTTIPQNELVDYCVRNLGYIALQSGVRALRVRLNPVRTSSQSLAQMLSTLSRDADRRCLLTVFTADETWADFLCGDLHAAVQKIADLAAERPGRFAGHLAGRTVRSRQEAAEHLAPHDPFAALLELWRERAQVFDDEHWHTALATKVQDRYLLVDANPSGHMLLERSGGGIPLLNGCWGHHRPGSRLDDGLDFGFAKWSAESYRRTAATRQPMLHSVDAIVQVPRRPAFRTRYRRLIMPVTYRQSPTYLLGCTVLDDQIDLGVRDDRPSAVVTNTRSSCRLLGHPGTGRPSPEQCGIRGASAISLGHKR